LPLLGREGHDAVARAPYLEGADGLQAFGLQKKLLAGQFGCVEGQQRRAPRQAD
jgi:hypothetical protein